MSIDAERAGATEPEEHVRSEHHRGAHGSRLASAHEREAGELTSGFQPDDGGPA